MAVNEISSFSGRNIWKGFGKTSLFRGLSITITKGERVLLIGPNGSGKSTLLKILAGIMHPEKGDFILNGNPVAHAPYNLIGYMGHSPMLYSPLSVTENLAITASLTNSHSSIQSLLERLNLSKYVDHRISELSQGTAFRVSLCRAILHNPQLLLLDEPTASFDEDATNRLKEYLNHWNSSGDRCGFIIATHDVRRLCSIANRIIVLKRGEIVKDSSGTFDDEDIVSLYLDAQLT
ncbi:MAG: ABC transporter ATP-binding protein [Candidatus Dadabacteria bacterium]|nr:MAG: ABC transporter ATP-binding protein [Candidatus Dadabacteria bacterium]